MYTNMITHIIISCDTIRIVCFADAEERGEDGEFSAMSEDEREAMGPASTAGAAAAGRRRSEGKAVWSDLDCRNPMFHAANANAEKAVARSVILLFTA